MIDHKKRLEELKKKFITLLDMAVGEASSMNLYMKDFKFFASPDLYYAAKDMEFVVETIKDCRLSIGLTDIFLDMNAGDETLMMVRRD